MTAGGCEVSVEHISACCNKCPGCVSWSDHGLIAIGSCNSVIICRSKTKSASWRFKSATQTLNEHTGRVNCVKWVCDAGDIAKPGTTYLLSGSSDNAVICWKCQESASGYLLAPIAKLRKHTAAVTAVDGIIIGDKVREDFYAEPQMVIVSASSDSTVLVWSSTLSSLEAGNITLLQEISCGHSLVMTIALHLLQRGPLVLACGLDNSMVELYSFTPSKCQSKDIHEHKFYHSMRLHGHEDWVRGVDFITISENDLLLATCSQDTFIRLWRIGFQEKSVDDNSDAGMLKLKEKKFTLTSHSGEQEYVVSLEAVLSGHDGWVYSVHWSHCSKGNCLRLLSASMDKSVIIWEMDADSGMWLEKVRFGEVGGNTLGFYGAQFNSEGTEVIAHSYNGALHTWEQANNDVWRTGITISGHFGPVLDLSWEPVFGRYVVSTGMDQTTRLWSSWNIGDAAMGSWHEIARPQIHGYDMQCVSLIDSVRFISGADEKVLRVFEAPSNFLHNFEKLTLSKISNSVGVPEGASVPALGLSNKAVFVNSQEESKDYVSRGVQYIENQFTSLMLDVPPPEEHLLQNTLWPEIRKLYSHVYEIFCVAANKSGTLVASATKAATPEHAAISLWCTKSWKEVAKLSGHSLTVTQMQFSNDGNFLLSVSRDRTWILHRISEGVDLTATMFARSNKQSGHTRIIWSASWTPDDKYFCTSSRNKKVMFWEVHGDSGSSSASETVTKISTMDAGEAVTSVAFSNRRLDSNYQYLFGVGKESGGLELYQFSATPGKIGCAVLYVFTKNEAHALAVKKMEWKPVGETNEDFLATCGMDHMVKVFRVDIVPRLT